MYLDAGGALPGVHELPPRMPAPEGSLDDDGRSQLALRPRALQPQAIRSVQMFLRASSEETDVHVRHIEHVVHFMTQLVLHLRALRPQQASTSWNSQPDQCICSRERALRGITQAASARHAQRSIPQLLRNPVVPLSMKMLLLWDDEDYASTCSHPYCLISEKSARRIHLLGSCPRSVVGRHSDYLNCLPIPATAAAQVECMRTLGLMRSIELVRT